MLSIFGTVVPTYIQDIKNHTMGKDLHIRDIDDKIHSHLGQSADKLGVSVNSIVKDAIDKWLRQQSEITKSHDIIIYNNDESMAKLLQSIDRLAKESDFFRSFCAPPSHKNAKILSKLDWFDGTIHPYEQEPKNISKYCNQTIANIAKASKNKHLCCFDFIITDIAKNSLKQAIEIESIYDKNRLSGLMFCIYKMETLVAAGIDNMVELFSKHDQVFLLSDDKLYKMQITEERPHKLVLK
jgi:hypothetical protein